MTAAVANENLILMEYVPRWNFKAKNSNDLHVHLHFSQSTIIWIFYFIFMTTIRGKLEKYYYLCLPGKKP